jgi:hypothetical protein
VSEILKLRNLNNEHYDQFFSLKLPFNDAQEYCRQKGMQMAMLKNFYEVQQVAQQIRQRNIDGENWNRLFVI